MDGPLRTELVAMRAEDLRVREELLRTGELGQGYAPPMETVHRQNAARLKQIIAEHGWPDRELVGDNGTLAAWFIAHHAIGEPDFQRLALRLVQVKVKESLPCPDGQYRRWQTEDPEHLNKRRAAIGLPPDAGWREG